MNKILLVGGIINLVFGGLHLSLPKMLNWSDTLSCLTPDNRATVFILNGSLAFVCLMFAYLSLFNRKEILGTGIGRAVTAAIGLFYILRAVTQVVYSGLSAPDTPFWVILCLLVSLLYLVPAVWKRPVTLAPTGS